MHSKFNHLNTVARLLIIGQIALVAACEGALYVEIQGDAPSVNGKLDLAFSEIEFVHEDGSSESFALDDTLRFDQDGLSLTTLLDGEDLPSGEYVQINLSVDADDSEYDHDGESDTDELDIQDGGTITASMDDVSFDIADDEVTSLILHLATFSSLPNTDDDDDEQELVPVVRLSDNSDSYDLSVTLTGDEAIGTHCADTDPQLPRLYIFDDAISTYDDDVEGDDDDPHRVVFADEDLTLNVSRQWLLPNLPAGSYRIALSCDDDDPSEEDGITFFCETTLDSLNSVTSIALDEQSSDAGCL